MATTNQMTQKKLKEANHRANQAEAKLRSLEKRLAIAIDLLVEVQKESETDNITPALRNRINKFLNSGVYKIQG